MWQERAADKLYLNTEKTKLSEKKGKISKYLIVYIREDPGLGRPNAYTIWGTLFKKQH